MNKKILDMVSQHKEDSFFTRTGFTDELRVEAERKLGLTLPSQFVEYLANFGHGGIGGVEILGVACDAELIFVEETELYRKYGLPNNLVVIENHDEWLSCIDCDNGKVVTWAQGEEVLLEHNCFDDYVVEEFQEAIDNL